MFVDVFNELLAENNLNKKQFSERSNIPYPTIIGWTNLNRLPDFTALNRVADFFQCSVDYLMGREGSQINLNPPVYSPKERELIFQYRKLTFEDKDLIFRLTEALCNAKNK